MDYETLAKAAVMLMSGKKSHLIDLIEGVFNDGFETAAAHAMKELVTILYSNVTGYAPQQDDLDRAFCERAGEPGHWDCGWCEKEKLPYFMCEHKAPRKGPELVHDKLEE